MALLPLQDAGAGLANITRQAASAGGDTITPGAGAAGWTTGVFLVVQNTDAAAKTATVDGVPFVVPATTGLAVIPVNGFYPNNPKTVTYSAVTGVTVAAVQVAG